MASPIQTVISKGKPNLLTAEGLLKILKSQGNRVTQKERSELAQSSASPELAQSSASPELTQSSASPKYEASSDDGTVSIPQERSRFGGSKHDLTPQAAGEIRAPLNQWLESSA